MERFIYPNYTCPAGNHTISLRAPRTKNLQIEITCEQHDQQARISADYLKSREQRYYKLPVEKN